MVALILYPSSVFLNRGKTDFIVIYYSNDDKLNRAGNHEDIMVTVRYGFHNEVNQKYRVKKTHEATNYETFVFVFCRFDDFR